jgi:restriction system protein
LLVAATCSPAAGSWYFERRATVAIPDFQTLMRPMLELASDGRGHSLVDARGQLGDRFELTDDERKALLPSGRQAIFVNRVAWAKV